jgi:transposase InsO family protein
LQGVIRGRRVRTTVADTAAPCPLDHVNRQFKAPRPNVLWVSDFTYVATWVGFVYVAFIIDAYARRIVGWRVSRSTHAGTAAAFSPRCPDADVGKCDKAPSATTAGQKSYSHLKRKISVRKRT